MMPSPQLLALLLGLQCGLPGARSLPSAPEGCSTCSEYRCPSEPGRCLLGLAEDPCGCCARGLCARLDNESCWNASIPELAKMRRNEGFCAVGYTCALRTDLPRGDLPEATCTCAEEGPVCADNGRTYPSLCAQREDEARHKLGSRRPPRFLHEGPCPTRPSIYSGPGDAVARTGRALALSCEARGFPLPDIFWEFHAADGSRVLRLPSEELREADVNASEGPGAHMRTSWLQLVETSPKVAGTYHCIANNSEGEASASSLVTLDV